MMMLSVSMWLYKGSTHKLVVMGRINFEDLALIKGQHACEKMNVMGGMFKDKKKWGNC